MRRCPGAPGSGSAGGPLRRPVRYGSHAGHAASPLRGPSPACGAAAIPTRSSRHLAAQRESLGPGRAPRATGRQVCQHEILSVTSCLSTVAELDRCLFVAPTATSSAVPCALPTTWPCRDGWSPVRAISACSRAAPPPCEPCTRPSLRRSGGRRPVPGRRAGATTAARTCPRRQRAHQACRNSPRQRVGRDRFRQHSMRVASRARASRTWARGPPDNLPIGGRAARRRGQPSRASGNPHRRLSRRPSRPVRCCEVPVQRPSPGDKPTVDHFAGRLSESAPCPRLRAARSQLRNVDLPSPFGRASAISRPPAFERSVAQRPCRPYRFRAVGFHACPLAHAISFLALPRSRWTRLLKRGPHSLAQALLRLTIEAVGVRPRNHAPGRAAARPGCERRPASVRITNCRRGRPSTILDLEFGTLQHCVGLMATPAHVAPLRQLCAGPSFRAQCLLAFGRAHYLATWYPSMELDKRVLPIHTTQDNGKESAGGLRLSRPPR